MNRLNLTYRRIRRAVLARRRLLASLLAAGAMAAGLQAATEPPPPTTAVLIAAHDIPAGTVVAASDLASRPFTPQSVPSGVLDASSVLGRTTSAPVRQGEPMTDVRLVAASLLHGYPGTVAAPVRIGDPGAVALLKVGDRVDVLAADPQGRRDAELVVAAVPVIALPRRSPSSSSMVSGGLVVLELSTM